MYYYGSFPWQHTIASEGGEGRRRNCSWHRVTDSSGPSNGMVNLHSLSNSIPMTTLWRRCHHSYFTEKEQKTQKNTVPQRKQLLMVVPAFQPRSVWCKDSALNPSWSSGVIIPSCSMVYLFWVSSGSDHLQWWWLICWLVDWGPLPLSQPSTACPGRGKPFFSQEHKQ